MEYRGFYINLADSTGRDSALRARLAALGCADRYHRFEAIRGSDSPLREQSRLPPGHLGCWLSHEALWRAQAASGVALHVLEDDAVPGRLLQPGLAQVQLPDDEWDLLFTDVYFHPPPTPEQFALLRGWIAQFRSTGQLRIARLGAMPFTGTTSYLVNHRSIGKLLGLLEGQWRAGHTLDVVLQRLVRAGQLRAFVTIPFLTTIGSENLQSTTGSQGPALAALNAFRQALYHDADARALHDAIRPPGCHADTEPLLGLYLELLRQVLGTVRTSS